jgi:diaminopropionate ammonia-lyase
MASIDISPYYFSPEAAHWRTNAVPVSARLFHKSMDGYAPTPLRELPELATELGVGRVFVKDESDRLGLPAFKILGASWAVCSAISRRLGLAPVGMTVASLRSQIVASGAQNLTLVTATDGNHGRAVARMASLLDLQSRIYIPSSISDAAATAIAAEGAEVIALALTYDEVVQAAAASVNDRPGELLIQDTSWLGYADVPQWIIEGYMTLFAEIDDQLRAAGVAGPDLVACPVGVGSLAQAMVEYYRGTADSSAVLLSVEPATADCILQSLAAGEMVTVDTSAPTMMAGLNCGTPSEIGWPALRDGLSAAVAIDEAACRKAVVDLHRWGQDSGPCGAASLAGMRAFLGSATALQSINLSPTSVMVLISTEGTAANPLPEG